MLDSSKKFAVVCLGCKVNRAEVDSYAARLLQAGWEMVEPKDASLVIINTCTVTSVADKKTRQAVRKVASMETPEEIIVTGCASAIEPNVYEAMDSRIKIVPKKEMQEAGLDAISQIAGENFRSRAAVKIQDGCNNACTYCIVHTARGAA